MCIDWGVGECGRGVSCARTLTTWCAPAAQEPCCLHSCLQRALSSAPPGSGCVAARGCQGAPLSRKRSRYVLLTGLCPALVLFFIAMSGVQRADGEGAVWSCWAASFGSRWFSLAAAAVHVDGCPVLRAPCSGLSRCQKFPQSTALPGVLFKTLPSGPGAPGSPPTAVL